MVDIEKAKTILGLVRDEVDRAIMKLVVAESTFAGRKAARDVWNRENPDDGVGGMSGNPYDLLRSEELDVKKAKDKLKEWRGIEQFVIETFLEGMPQDDDIS